MTAPRSASNRRTRRALLVVAMLGAGCGARTALDLPVEEGGAGGAHAGSSHASSASTAIASSAVSTTAMSSSTGLPPCLDDSECDDGVDCTIDTCEPEGCINEPDDGACADGVFCTLDTCLPGMGCSNVFTDAVCDDGIGCTSDACDMMLDACVHVACDGACDDGVFCDGVERCDTTFGCTLGPPACDLDLACSTDTCTAGPETCSHSMSAGCAPNVHLLVTDQSGALRDIQPYTGTSTFIAPTSGAVHLDIAILAGRWFALNSANIFELFPNTNTVKNVLPGVSANSLAGGPDGKLYAAGVSVFRIDPDTGAAIVVGNLPPGESSSGDIAFLNGKMYISTDGPCGGSLVSFDVALGSGTVLGGDGLGCVYGLAVKSGILYVLNCDGKLGTFDPTTGEARVLSTSNATVYGADAL